MGNPWSETKTKIQNGCLSDGSCITEPKRHQSLTSVGSRPEKLGPRGLPSAQLKGPRKTLKNPAGNRRFGTHIGPNTGRTQAKNARSGAHKPIPIDFGPASRCFHHDTTFRNCEIAQPSPVREGHRRRPCGKVGIHPAARRPPSLHSPGPSQGIIPARP